VKSELLSSVWNSVVVIRLEYRHYSNHPVSCSAVDGFSCIYMASGASLQWLFSSMFHVTKFENGYRHNDLSPVQCHTAFALLIFDSIVFLCRHTYLLLGNPFWPDGKLACTGPNDIDLKCYRFVLTHLTHHILWIYLLVPITCEVQ